MKKFVCVIGLSAALLMGSAFAYSPVQIDDSGFDYAVAEDGYTSILFEDGKLTLVITDDMTDASLKFEGSEYLPLDSDRANDLNELALQAYIPIETSLSGTRVAHADADMSTVVAAYTKLFEAQGFSSSIEKTYAHGEVLLFKTDSLNARVIFTQQGQDVQVFFTTL